MSDRHKHSSRACVAYGEGFIRCEDCMSPEEEIDFWRECYQGEHGGPEDCPTYYDGCNCGGTMAKEVERLLAKVKEMKNDK